jgi:hypothetical protein
MTRQDTYPVNVRTENSQAHSGPTPDEFRRILRSLGCSGNSWLIADLMPARPGHFFQVLRESAAYYRTEIREGTDGPQVGALVHSAEAVAELIAAWAAGSGMWRAAQNWVPFDELDSLVEPDSDIAAEAANQARELVAGGYLSRFEVARALVDYFSGPGGQLLIVHPQAARVVARVWQERLAEQEAWPERTDTDALEDAFAALERQNIVARADFACCANCGHTEIGAEAGPDSLGYVFFHRQSTQQVVRDGRLWLYFGACGPDRDQDAVVGRKIADAISETGLLVEWNGDARTAIEVGPLTWRKRLPGAAAHSH